MFLSVIRKGLFWSYLEMSSLHPEVREEYKEPCSRLYIRDKKSLLFEVTYYKKRINFEVFHVLTDGNGAMVFLKTLAARYLTLMGKQIPFTDGVLDTSARPKKGELEDAFSKYAAFRKRAPRRESKAIISKGP